MAPTLWELPSPESTFASFGHPYDRTHYYRAHTVQQSGFCEEHRAGKRNRYEVVLRWNGNYFFFVPAQIRSELYRHAQNGWNRDKNGPRELCIPISVVSAYSSHHLLRDSGTGRRLPDVL